MNVCPLIRKRACVVFWGDLSNHSSVDSSAVVPIMHNKQNPSTFSKPGCNVNMYNAPVTTPGFSKQKLLCRLPKKKMDNDEQ